MNLHEYQGKELFARYGLPTSDGIFAKTEKDVEAALNKIGAAPWVLKAQVHAGGRGKAGGIKITSDKSEALEFAKKMLGSRLITYQTDKDGQPVSGLWIEKPTDIAKEFYLGAVLDRASRRVVFMASTEGGVDIEKVAHENPEKILKVAIDPFIGALPFQGRELAFALGLSGTLVQEFTNIFVALGKVFFEKDCSIIEVNPLVLTKQGHLHCLDAKVVIDGSALYRHPDLKAMDDPTQEDARERRAAEWDLNYVSLSGDIGCMVNGAGLAMATMDIIQLLGSSPANFLDVGGGATKERVTEAFKIILSDQKVRAIFINIFGGIVRCDLIADGIMTAIADVGVPVPVVVRLEGNNAELGLKKLQDSGLNVRTAKGFNEAAQLVVELAKTGAKS